MSIDSKLFDFLPYFDELEDDKLSQFVPSSLSDSKVKVDRTEKKSITESIHYDDEPSLINNLVDSSHINEKSQTTSRNLSIMKNHKSLLPQLLSKKIKRGKNEITIYFFNTNKRITFTRYELCKFFSLESKEATSSKEAPLIRFFIPFIVKNFCKEFLNFIPKDVNPQYFLLKLANQKNQDDGLIDEYGFDEDINMLFECGNLVLVRKPKDDERVLVWNNEKADMEVLQIIISGQRQMIQKIEKNKNVSALKEKILSSNHLLDKIIIVTYHEFKICQPKQKIADIVATDRILEVYAEMPLKFEDNVVSKPKKEIIEIPSQKKSISTEFQMVNNMMSGRLFVKLVDKKIIERYEGGLWGYFVGKREVQRSVYTLVGLASKGLSIKLQFMHKEGYEICEYNFLQKCQKEQFLKLILKLERQLKQNFVKIQ